MCELFFSVLFSIIPVSIPVITTCIISDTVNFKSQKYEKIFDIASISVIIITIIACGVFMPICLKKCGII